MSRAVIVFLRRPIKGEVKSRLAKDVGESKALEIYNWLLHITFQAIANIKPEVLLYFDKTGNEMPNWSSDFPSYIQDGINLGLRMKSAVSEQLEKFEKVILIGSDCPEISEELLNIAFDSLNQNDLVLGPAVDGGIYLLGMNKNLFDVFENVNWGTSAVFNQMIFNAEKLHLRTSVLQRLSDVDVIDDFKRYEGRFNDYIINEKNAVEGKG